MLHVSHQLASGPPDAVLQADGLELILDSIFQSTLLSVPRASECPKQLLVRDRAG